MQNKAISPTYAQYLLSQQDLFSRILNFNQEFHALQRKLLSQKSGKEISDTLFNLHPELAAFHSEHNISYCFENSADRLCLLRLNELDQLVVYLGACISASQLARVSSQKDINIVYAQIGRKIYNFALDYGYLIKSFDYEPDLNSLKDDCTYLGLCALKCLQSLFSSNELRNFFVNFLTNYTKSRNLDPAIITSEQHILSTVEPVANPLQPPSPTQMNTPVQYTAIDSHPSLDKHTPKPQTYQSPSEQENKTHLSLQIFKPPVQVYDAEPHRQPYAPFAQVPSKIPIGAIIKKTPDKAQQININTKLPEDTPSLTPLPTAHVPPAPHTAQTLTTKTSANATVENSDLPPTVGAPLPPTYENAALYSGPNAKDKRIFISASMQQQSRNQTTVTNATDTTVPDTYAATTDNTSTPPTGAEPNQTLVNNQLVTLEFNATQVFTLTKLILESQIDENWYEYLI